MIVKGLIEFVMTRFVTEGLNAMFHHNSTREEAIKRRFEWCEGLECASVGFIVRIEGFYVTYCYVIAGRLQSPEESCRSFVLKRLNRLGEQHARKPPTFSGFSFILVKFPARVLSSFMIPQDFIYQFYLFSALAFNKNASAPNLHNGNKNITKLL